MTGPTVTELVGVYNADGSVVGELAYLAGRLTGRAHCALCDITHGKLRRRRDFDTQARRLTVPMQLVHRDEMGPDLAAIAGQALPCVIARTPTETRVLLGPADLESCRSDPTRLIDAIVASARAAGYDLPDRH